MAKRVVFSASTRFYADRAPWVEYLRQNNVEVDAPVLQFSEQDWAAMDEGAKHSAQLKLVTDHNLLIDTCDVLFVFNPGGYVGNSVTLEIGYALAKGKVIYAMEADQELGRSVVYAGLCETPADLMQMLQ